MFNSVSERIRTWSVSCFHSFPLITNLNFCVLKDIKSVVSENLHIKLPPANVVDVNKLSTAIALLHVIGFALAGLAVLFAVIPGCIPWQRTLFSGIAALAAVAVTVLDFIVVIWAYKRINSLTNGGHAQLSWALWLTLAASCLLTLSAILSHF